MEQEQKQGRGWVFSVGLYPGILFGVRIYENEEAYETVLHLLFVELSFYIEKRK